MVLVGSQEKEHEMLAYQRGKLRTAMREMIVWLHCRAGLGLLLMYRRGFSLQQYQPNNNERQLRHTRLSRVSRPQETQSPHSHIPHLMSKQQQKKKRSPVWCKTTKQPDRGPEAFADIVRVFFPFFYFLLERHKTDCCHIRKQSNQCKKVQTDRTV